MPKPWGAREATRAFEVPVWARERQEGAGAGSLSAEVLGVGHTPQGDGGEEGPLSFVQRGSTWVCSGEKVSGETVWERQQCGPAAAPP